jgi:hypothetical protein
VVGICTFRREYYRADDHSGCGATEELIVRHGNGDSDRKYSSQAWMALASFDGD